MFAIDVEKCAQCGGRVRIIAAIEDPEVIEKILRHLVLKEGERRRRGGLPGEAAGPAMGDSMSRSRPIPSAKHARG